MSWEGVVGLEVHAQLMTRSKLFCGCATRFGAPPNSQACEVCLGMPGALPVLNRSAVELALRAAVALECHVDLHSVWARKSYFYPDLPKGYQISQHDRPLATRGTLQADAAELDGAVGITRLHLEEDAGKSTHDEPQLSCIDFNRSGLPLIEIVSQPELRSGAEAAAYLKALRQLLRYLDVCDGNMERGNLRCDVNVSVRPQRERALGIRTEVKNLNSFRHVQQAVDYEIERQRNLLASGGEIVQETRCWDPRKRVTRALRSKEEAHDYRYFPEPDLPTLVLTQDDVQRARAELPELPAARRARFSALGLSDYDARVLTDDREVADYFEAALAGSPSPKGIANWVSNEVLRVLKDKPLADLRVEPLALAALVELVDQGTLSSSMAKIVFEEMAATGNHPRAIVESRGLRQEDDVATLSPIVARVIAANPDSVAAYENGKERALGFLVGRVMKESGGRANPKRVRDLVRDVLTQKTRS